MTPSGGGARRLFAFAAVLVALAVLLGLGVWQLQRLAWKEALIAERISRLAEVPIALPQSLDDIEPLLQRRVALTGRFLHEGELYLGARSWNGRAGFHLVTPLLLPDGRSLLVDRGWLPPERMDPASRPETRVPGEVSLVAWLRPGGWAGSPWFKPANEPDKRLWIWPDLPEMARVAGLERPVTALYAEALEPSGGDLRPAEPTVALRNDHLQYAITWFALAGTLVIIYALYLLRHKSTRP